MPTNSIQFIAVLASVVGLFSYVLKLLLPYLFRKLDERDAVILKLTTDFTNASNHKTTEFTKAVGELKNTMEINNTHIAAQTEIFKQLIHDK